MEPDFSGWATKAGLKCSDGRTITPEAFKHMDGVTVPLVWQHGHGSVDNVLGHAKLEARADGVYTYAYFNGTQQGQNAKQMVQHGDVVSLSIYANNLVEKMVGGGKAVLHGMIREVSLVLSGANPGALIENIAIQHDGGEIEALEDEARIFTGLSLEHAEAPAAAETNEGPTVQEVYASMNDEQKNVVHYMVGQALEGAGGTAQHSEEGEQGAEGAESGTEGEQGAEGAESGTEGEQGAEGAESGTEGEQGGESGESAEGSENNDEGDLTHQEGTTHMNVFEKQGGGVQTQDRPTLTHDQMQTIINEADQNGSFKQALLAHADEYGITNIELLFPDAKAVDSAPELITRAQAWVAPVLSGVRKLPWSRIKSLSADVTHDDARAKGYVKVTMKKEEYFSLTKRETTPKTIYKKQRLDRDDIIDVTELDVVTWLWAEMRLMLNEEIARAILIGDGREVDDEDKIDETKIRPIAFDHEFYTDVVICASDDTTLELIDRITANRYKYKGIGNPTLFCTEQTLAEMLLVRDTMGRKIYPTLAELTSDLRVSRIVTVPVMEDVQHDDGELIFILVNLSDYTVGTDKGGEISTFDDFDIDFNQYKYLIEGRMSGALTKHKTAQVFVKANGTEVTPTVPTFVSSTGVVTIPTVTGVVYKNATTGATLSAGAQTAIASGATVLIEAVPSSGSYHFPHLFDADWSFTRD